MIWYRSWQPEKFWDFEKLQYLNLCFNPVYISTISQLVACLGLDLNSTTSTNPPRPFPNPYSSNYDPEEKFVCRMCNNAEPMSMAKLIRHIFYENADYEMCRQAIAQNGRAAFTRLGHKRDLPANLNDHCISSDHTAEMLWSQISTDEVAQFNNAKLARDNYMNQYRSQDYRSITQNYWVERKGLFSCSLCPKVSRLNSRVLGDMIFHVNGKHGVEVLSILEERSMELAEANQEGTTH
ncbi:hypothetical protein FRC02_009587 [Tulasnella sp. 418]|nr:hypothetical protein FRC02_009587 [Tulasnella sp. 418]